MPCAVRGNATHMTLWKTKNRNEFNLIAKEMAGEVSPEKFIEVHEYIVSDEEDRHVFMFIDLHKKTTIQVRSITIIQTLLLCKAVIITAVRCCLQCS